MQSLKTTMKKAKIYFILLFSSWVHAQQDVTVAADTLHIRIGEQIQYTITSKEKENVRFPMLENLKGLEVISTEKVDTLSDRLERNYILTSFDSGRYVIPKQELFIQNKAYYTDSLTVHVAAIAVDTLKQKPFPRKPIVAEPMIFDDYRPYFVWLWVLAGVFFIVGVIYYLWKKYGPQAPVIEEEKIPPYQEAIEKFASLEEKQLWQNNKIKEYYIELTEIVRVYVAREIKISTLEATTDELIQRVTVQNQIEEIGIEENLIQELQVFLKHADFVKFAKLRPLAEEIRKDNRDAKKIVESLQPIMKMYKEARLLEYDEHAKNSKSAQKVSFLLRSKTIYVVVILILAMLMTFGIQKFLQNTSAGALSEFVGPSVSNDVWKKQSFGDPALTLQAPVEIVLQTDAVPLPLKDVVASMSRYEYKAPQDAFFININTRTYAKNNANIEEELQKTIQDLQNNATVENFEYERLPVAFKNGLQGVCLSGSMKKDGVSKEFKLIGVADQKKLWQVTAAYNAENTTLKTMMASVIASINIER